MKLAIIDFIKSHSNWEELLSNAPYNLIIKREGALILFKYSQISSDFNEEICREARGLILEDKTWRVVRMAFKKFFNIGEIYADSIDWDTAVATEKIDGSIISVYYYDGQWRIATNSTIDAFKTELQDTCQYETFGALFESVLPLEKFKDGHLENLCFTFELASPFNRVVLEYPEPAVYLLSIRYMDTLEEMSYDRLNNWAVRLGVKRPQSYYMNDETGFRHLVENMGEGHEGIVVLDARGNRVKIKTELYFQLHHLANNGVMTLERAVELVLANDYEEFLSYFSGFREYFSHIRNVREKILARIEVIPELMKGYSSKKEIALDDTIPHWEKRFYFNAFDKREINLGLRDWCNLIKMWEELYNVE